MSRWRNRRDWLVLFIFLLCPFVRAAVDLQPRPNEIFPRLLADPRHIQFSASYYRLDGKNTSDIALGHSWGLNRLRSGQNQDWLWEMDIEAMVYSRFSMTSGASEFEMADFIGNLPITVRRGNISFKGMLFHKSSHLGDDYIRQNGKMSSRYSTEGLRLLSAVEPTLNMMCYAGTQYVFHSVPVFKPWSMQGGFELNSNKIHWLKFVPSKLFVAQDMQWHQNVQWNMDFHSVIGLKLYLQEMPSRLMRIQAGYFNGHSPFGQFYTQREHYLDLAIALEL